MTTKKNKRTRILNIRLSESEFRKIHDEFSRSTKRKRSEYIRSILLNKPITVYTRNKSIDDFLDEIILLRRELNAIGNNFNQSVKRLHMSKHISEIKTWAILNENSKELFFKKIEKIENKIIQIDNKWSQE
jgi:MobC-like protein